MSATTSRGRRSRLSYRERCRLSASTSDGSNARLTAVLLPSSHDRFVASHCLVQGPPTSHYYWLRRWPPLRELAGREIDADPVVVLVRGIV